MMQNKYFPVYSYSAQAPTVKSYVAAPTDPHTEHFFFAVTKRMLHPRKHRCHILPLSSQWTATSIQRAIVSVPKVAIGENIVYFHFHID